MRDIVELIDEAIADASVGPDAMRAGASEEAHAPQAPGHFGFRMMNPGLANVYGREPGPEGVQWRQLEPLEPAVPERNLFYDTPQGVETFAQPVVIDREHWLQHVSVFGGGHRFEFEMRDGPVRMEAGKTVTVRFEAELTGEGRKYFATVVPEDEL